MGKSFETVVIIREVIMQKIMIGICDDERLILNLLKRKIEECILKKGWVAEIITFESGMELLERVPEIDVVFLDIEMPDLDGIETGRYIQSLNGNCKIIMATSKVERFKESFRINAFRFITKPFEAEEIEEALQAVWDSQMGMDLIELYDRRIQYSFLQRDISYIISYDSYAEFFVGNKVLRKEIALNELEKILDKSLFHRVHRQYMVNMLWIVRYKNGVINLDKKEIPVARRKKKDFEQAYMEFDLKYSRFTG